MTDKPLNRQQVVEGKLVKKLQRHRRRKKVKIDSDIDQVKELVSALEPESDDELVIIGNMIDFPSVILTFAGRIVELYVSTWSITPAGMSALDEIASSPLCCKAVLLMDKTHSYKWMFSSGAYAILKDHVQIRCCANHSKLLALKLVDGTVVCVYGSMNLSNNPRWENMIFTRNTEDYLFISSFIEEVETQNLKYGKEEDTGRD